MREPLLTVSEELVAGTVVDRPNRFVVHVRFDGDPERVFLGDPGTLEGIVEPGAGTPLYGGRRPRAGDGLRRRRGGRRRRPREPAGGAGQRPVRAGGDPSGAAGVRGLLDRAAGAAAPGSRPDGLPAGDARRRAGVRGGQITHVERGVATFPDRQTGRGRRYPASLRSLREDGPEAHVVFVVQRPDVERLRPFRAVDPESAARLEDAERAGVGVHAMATAFDPPHYRLHEPALAVHLG